MKNTTVSIYPDLTTLSHEAALFIVRAAQESIVTHGRFIIALSGGGTPKQTYTLLGREPYRDQIDWALVEVFWSDERCVPAESEDSSYRMAMEAFLSNVPIPASQIHRVPADAADRDAASLAYTREMQSVFGTDSVPAFDLIQLGMGPEAHTASLFPHQSSLHERERLVMPVTVPKPPPPRLTFTPVLLNAATRVLFLVTGRDKAEAIQAVLEGDYQPDEYPAQVVRPPKGFVTWMLDDAAASRLATRG